MAEIDVRIEKSPSKTDAGDDKATDNAPDNLTYNNLKNYYVNDGPKAICEFRRFSRDGSFEIFERLTVCFLFRAGQQQQQTTFEIGIVIFILANLACFAERFYHYGFKKEQQVVFNLFGWGLPLARGAALPIKLDCAVLLFVSSVDCSTNCTCFVSVFALSHERFHVFKIAIFSLSDFLFGTLTHFFVVCIQTVLRNFLSFLRSTPIAAIIPLDKNIQFHKGIAWVRCLNFFCSREATTTVLNSHLDSPFYSGHCCTLVHISSTTTDSRSPTRRL